MYDYEKKSSESESDWLSLSYKLLYILIISDEKISWVMGGK